MRKNIFGLIPPPSQAEHRRARIWAAGALALLALMMTLLLILTRLRKRLT